jgi:hypothetical protein
MAASLVKQFFDGVAMCSDIELNAATQGEKACGVDL